MTTVKETVATSGDPMDSRMDDVVALLHHRAAGLRTIDRYVQDAKTDPNLSALLQAIRAQDASAIEQLKEYLRCRLAGYETSTITEPW